MTKSLLTILAVLSALSPVSGGVTELTSDNYEAKMKGKNSFVKFFAPWCGHCKSMKPAWDQLGDVYAASSSVLIADVDCTASGEELCNKLEVRGYPTIKYFVDGDMEGQQYQGARDFESLKNFAAESLEVKCDVSNPAECTEKEKSYIEKMMAKTKEERVKQMVRLEGMAFDPMKDELKAWLHQRLHILKSLEPDEA